MPCHNFEFPSPFWQREGFLLHVRYVIVSKPYNQMFDLKEEYPKSSNNSQKIRYVFNKCNMIKFNFNEQHIS